MTWISGPDQNGMFSAMLGFKGASFVDVSSSETHVHVTFETEEVAVTCPTCGGAAKPDGVELVDLPRSEFGLRVADTTWRRRQFRCADRSCPQKRFGEPNDDVDAFIARVVTGFASRLAEKSSSLSSPRRDRL